MNPLSEVFETRVVPLDLCVFARTCARFVRSRSRPIGWCEFTILATVSHGVNLTHGVLGAPGGGQ